MRVVATAQGFDNLKLREPGDEFDMPSGAKGSWFKPVTTIEGPKHPQARAKEKAVSGAAEDDKARDLLD